MWERSSRGELCEFGQLLPPTSVIGPFRCRAVIHGNSGCCAASSPTSSLAAEPSAENVGHILIRERPSAAQPSIETDVKGKPPIPHAGTARPERVRAELPPCLEFGLIQDGLSQESGNDLFALLLEPVGAEPFQAGRDFAWVGNDGTGAPDPRDSRIRATSPVLNARIDAERASAATVRYGAQNRLFVVSPGTMITE